MSVFMCCSGRTSKKYNTIKLLYLNAFQCPDLHVRNLQRQVILVQADLSYQLGNQGFAFECQVTFGLGQYLNKKYLFP